MVSICNRRLSGAASRRASNYAIDDFINQLLASEKFDELAEKVADKAVKKIKNIDNGIEFVEKDHKDLNEEDEQQHRYQEKKREYEDKDEKEAFKDREQRSNNNDVKPGKINTDVLMKRDDDSRQSEGLTLKYKYLKQHAMEKKATTPNVEDEKVEHSASEERSPIWRNLENSEEKQKRPAVGEREQEPIQIRQWKHDSNEKYDDKEYDKNLKFERNPNYDRNIEANNNYEKEHDRFSKVSDTENFKNRFFLEHEREQREQFEAREQRNKNEVHEPEQNEARKREQNEAREREKSEMREHEQNEARDNGRPIINERDREESLIRDKQDHEENIRPQFKSELAKEEDVPAVVIDLDDNDHSNKPQSTEQPGNVYKEIVSQQKIVKTDFAHDEAEDEDHIIKDSENIFGDDHKILEEPVSEEDDTYRRIPDTENAVTSASSLIETTTRKRMIRREGNRFYTYLSAPEYADYHEELAKQTKNGNGNQFDII